MHRPNRRLKPWARVGTESLALHRPFAISNTCTPFDEEPHIADASCLARRRYGISIPDSAGRYRPAARKAFAPFRLDFARLRIRTKRRWGISHLHIPFAPPSTAVRFPANVAPAHGLQLPPSSRLIHNSPLVVPKYNPNGALRSAAMAWRFIHRPPGLLFRHPLILPLPAFCRHRALQKRRVSRRAVHAPATPFDHPSERPKTVLVVARMHRHWKGRCRQTLCGICNPIRSHIRDGDRAGIIPQMILLIHSRFRIAWAHANTMGIVEGQHLLIEPFDHFETID